MSLLPFRKLHGLGNDFIFFDGISASLPLGQLTDAGVAARLCDRHFGIGADGLLLLLPPEMTAADARMRILNADGSEPEMCGNGIRCLARAVHDHLPGYRGRTRISIQTGAGLLVAELRFDASGDVAAVRVDMGRPSLCCASLPMEGGACDAAGRFIEQSISPGAGEVLRSTAVSMGNPHLVTFVGDDRDPHELATSLGPLLEHHPWFPRRINVEFARPRSPGCLELWVWERGCGVTMACGTGACATAVAAVVTGRHPAGQPLQVELPGGVLSILVSEDLSRVWMEGPAVEVFQGTVEI
jgi:diaminopimelate epimerase